ncbi:type II secretion system protein [Humisphaera borealis]|uniref:Type II secretion system protein n=1 Tax=Humisphaera borealis TaxID=2807512 RepID=A0A7M2WRT9_9BACT|nr:type II secretion system protein [Humisphaera borealis]QOV87521.1 type II secretion system protein [Humisphaera borealis]
MSPQPAPFSVTRRRGLTLVEVMFSIVVMSTMLLAALGSVGAVAKARVTQKESVQGLALARQLLSEIVQTRYKDLVDSTFGIEAGESRATFDDVDDYNGLSEASALYADGTAVAGGTRWSRTVAVSWVSPTDPSTTSATDQGLKRIKVSVTSPGGRVTTLEALRSAENGYEHTPGSQATYTCHVGVSIQIGTNTVVRNVQGVALNNLVP